MFITEITGRTLLFFYALDLVQIIGYSKTRYTKIVNNSLQCLVLLVTVIIMPVIRIPETWILLVRFQEADH